MLPWGRDKMTPRWGQGRGTSSTASVRVPGRNSRLPQMKDTAAVLPDPPLGPQLQSISRTDLLPDSDVANQTVKIRDPEVIASYNWLDKSIPSIVIPGGPPAWMPLHKPRKLKEDSGVYYRDLNAAHFPKHPMEPAIEAVMRVCSHEYAKTSSSGPDIVACGSTLGNLLRFVRGDMKPFRILVEVVGNTVHLIRREKSPREIIPDVRGYGHTFPEAYTTWDASVRGSLSHQRMMRYRLGELDCIVRFECDGYIPGQTNLDHTQEGVRSTQKVPDGSVGSVSDTLGGLVSSLDISPASPGSNPRGLLSISSAGSLKPQLSTFELKTRTIKRRHMHDELLEEELPRLWLKQVSSFIVGYHTYGEFQECVITNVQSDIRAWEQKHADELKRFMSLLLRIVQFARDLEESKFEIIRMQDSDKIDIRLQTPDLSPMLSIDAHRRWVAWLSGDDDRADKKGVEEQGSRTISLGGEVSEDVPSLNYTACDDECGYCGQCSNE